MSKNESSNKKVCGIVMPISEIDGCPNSHWADVRSIIEEAAAKAGFEAKLVSQSDDIGVIQARIVQNIYDADIIVCDVSAKNANVMFELGLRLAFDKPAIVLKDDQTSYSFDTSPIEHLEYPRGLRYNEIVDLKENLAAKLTATLEASKKPNYQSFLKHFGKFKVTGLETKEVDKEDYLLRELQTLKAIVLDIKRDAINSPYFLPRGHTTESSKATTNQVRSILVREIALAALNDIEFNRDISMADKEKFVTRLISKHPNLLKLYGGEDMVKKAVSEVLREIEAFG
jgi:hypothetical protein